MLRVDRPAVELDGSGYCTHEGRPFTGVVVKRWPNGRESERTRYSEGWIDGCQQRWNEAGQLIRERWFDSSTPVDVWSEWHDNGELRSEETFEHGLTVATREFDDAGNLVREWHIDENASTWKSYLREKAKAEQKTSPSR